MDATESQEMPLHAKSIAEVDKTIAHKQHANCFAHKPVSSA